MMCLMKILNWFQRRPQLILQPTRTPEERLNSTLLSARGPVLDAINETLSAEIAERWTLALSPKLDDRQVLQAVAECRSLVEYKDGLQRRLNAALKEEKRVQEAIRQKG